MYISSVIPEKLSLINVQWQVMCTLDICRALKTLTVDMDPMPDEIRKDFNLLNLYDVSNFFTRNILKLEFSQLSYFLFLYLT